MMWMQHQPHKRWHKDGTMHEWVLCELRAICRRYGLCVRGNKADALARVVSHVASK